MCFLYRAYFAEVLVCRACVSAFCKSRVLQKCFLCSVQAMLEILLLLVSLSPVRTAALHGASALTEVLGFCASALRLHHLLANRRLFYFYCLADNLLHGEHARVYVADLPPKYNLHIIAQEGCKDGDFLKTLLSNPLGPLFDASLESALYRCATTRWSGL